MPASQYVLTNVDVLGTAAILNVYSANALTTTNLFANTLTLANASSTINVIGSVTASTFYGALAGSNTGTFSNVYSANALTTTNVYASNIADQTGTFGTTGQVLTKAEAGTLWAAAGGGSSQWTGTVGTPIYYVPQVGIGSSTTPTSNLQVTGNAYVSNALTTTNLFANTLTLNVNGTFRASGATSLASVSINSAGQLVPTGAGGVATNTAVGQAAMQANTTGYQNTAVGQAAMQANTTGNFNTAVGTNAMLSNTTGSGNTAVGQNAMVNNTTGQNNTAVGQNAMYANTTGVANTAVGDAAMYANTTGQNNTAVGTNAMQANTTGQNNTAVGQAAMLINTTGFNNTAVGMQAMLNNTTGQSNTAVGQSAMRTNTTGQGNTAVGQGAMRNNTTGQSNTAVGSSAMYNTTSNNNTAVGSSAMYNNTTGQNNTAVGQTAMYNNTTGQNNTAVGEAAMLNNTTGQNNVCLGVNSGSDALVNITTESNYVVLGNNSTATLYCKTSTINTSDARDKTNVESIAVGLDYVRKLKPVTFNFDDRGWYPEGQAPDGSKACSIHRLGFLAQDILAAEQELGLPFNHVVNTDFPEKLGIAPTNLIPILVKAIQELEQSLATVTANISSLQPPSAPANPQSSP